jgi:hypothetical protein
MNRLRGGDRTSKSVTDDPTPRRGRDDVRSCGPATTAKFALPLFGDAEHIVQDGTALRPQQAAVDDHPHLPYVVVRQQLTAGDPPAVQAQELCGLDAAACDDTLDALVSEGYLRQALMGYVKA